MKSTFLAWCLLMSPIANATVSCTLNEGDGASVSADTRVKAEKAAWNKCIDKKLAMRELRDGKVSVDTAELDAESCLNAKITCR